MMFPEPETRKTTTMHELNVQSFSPAMAFSS